MRSCWLMSYLPWKPGNMFSAIKPLSSLMIFEHFCWKYWLFQIGDMCYLFLVTLPFCLYRTKPLKKYKKMWCGCATKIAVVFRSAESRSLKKISLTPSFFCFKTWAFIYDSFPSTTSNKIWKPIVFTPKIYMKNAQKLT